MLKPRGRPISRDGIELRKAIRADVDANPAMAHLDLRRKYGVAQPVVDSALTQTVAEWDACIAGAPEPARAGMGKEPARAKPAVAKPPATVKPVQPPANAAPEPRMPGLEQGYVKFTRTPAKMGEDYIFWIPRVYVRNGLVDPGAEYEIYLRKPPKEKSKD